VVHIFSFQSEALGFHVFIMPPPSFKRAHSKEPWEAPPIALSRLSITQ
jgi:hypothetical protein